MSILWVGLRSVGRNRRRTFVTTGAMAFAGVVMIFYSALLEGFMETMERNALGMDIGEIQLHAPGYRHDPDLYKHIELTPKILEGLRTRGFEAAPRLYGFGLAAAGVSSSGVQFRGIRTIDEARVTRIHEHLQKGNWLSEDDPKGVVVGRKLAKSLRVDISDPVVVLSQAADGSMANDIYNVRGILASVGNGIDRSGLFMLEDTFRELFVLPKGVHEIVLVRKDRTTDLRVSTERVSAFLPKLETLSWKELQPMLAKMMDVSLGSQLFLLLITYVAIAMVVLNATLMSVFERVREFGVMKALGVTPKQVLAVVFVEVMAQTALASMIAVGLGWPIAYYVQIHGLDLTALATETSMMGIAFDPVWYSRVTPSSIIIPVVVLFVVVGVSAVYPGVKAAVIRPVEAIHHQ